MGFMKQGAPKVASYAAKVKFGVAKNIVSSKGGNINKAESRNKGEALIKK